MTDSPPPLLEARGVHVEFRPPFRFGRRRFVVRAVREACLHLRRGEVLGIVGESGSGKSTLALALLGLQPLVSGEVLLDGVPIARLPRRHLARRMQPVFQNPYAALNPVRRVGAAIRQPLDVHRVGDRAARRAAVDAVMRQVGLPPRLAGLLPAHLSGGQRQRVAIGRAVVLRPDLLVCDEPTSALDVSVQAQILNLLADLRAATGLACIVISHNLAVIEHIADRVAVMYLGRIVETAPARDLFAAPLHPYTRALQAAVLTPDPALGLPEETAEDTVEVPGEDGCPYAPRCPLVMPVCRAVMPGQRRRDAHAVACHLYDDAPG